jgi:hypothetical protein
VNLVGIGGGVATHNAATRIQLYVAANNTTTTGTEVADFRHDTIDIGTNTDADMTLGRNVSGEVAAMAIDTGTGGFTVLAGTANASIGGAIQMTSKGKLSHFTAIQGGLDGSSPVLTLEASGSGADVAIIAGDSIFMDSVDSINIESSAGVINIGADAVAQNINIGTGAAARVITVGNVTGATGVAYDAGTAGHAFTGDMGFYGTTPVAQSAAYTPTNVVTDRAYDANSTSTAELADVLGTLIADLQALGLIG